MDGQRETNPLLPNGGGIEMTNDGQPPGGNPGNDDPKTATENPGNGDHNEQRTNFWIGSKYLDFNKLTFLAFCFELNGLFLVLFNSIRWFNSDDNYCSDIQKRIQELMTYVNTNSTLLK